jgi:hypothetical protein
MQALFVWGAHEARGASQSGKVSSPARCSLFHNMINLHPFRQRVRLGL